MKILQLIAENVKRIKTATITANPDGSLVVLAGANEQGKSSAIDAIAYALGGEKLIPEKPVRQGAKKAVVTVILDDYVVTRTIQASGGGSLVVTNREGLKYPTPQALLDGLLGKLAFDPLAFAQAKPADQATTLRALAHLDTTDLDTARKVAYDRRTEVNRELTRAQAAVSSAPVHAGVGTTILSSDEVRAPLVRADNLHSAAVEAERRETFAESRQNIARAILIRANARVESLRADLEVAEAESEQAEMIVAVAEDEVRAASVNAAHARSLVLDRDDLRAQFDELVEHNRQAEENRRRDGLMAQVNLLSSDADRLTETIARYDTEKAERLAAAVFPVDGLGLDDAGVTWQGLPFTQASTAVRTRVSVAIGIALNPTLKVLLVRGGNDLDDRSLAAVAAQAHDAGAQIWLERIAGAASVTGAQTVVFEDGEVISCQ